MTAELSTLAYCDERVRCCLEIQLPDGELSSQLYLCLHRLQCHLVEEGARNTGYSLAPRRIRNLCSSISEIADLFDFSDSNNFFGRIVKCWFGQTSSQYSNGLRNA